MSLLCPRLLIRSFRNEPGVLHRFYFKKSDDPHVVDVATTNQKFEMLQIKAGYEDPFRMRAVKRHPSSKNNPNIVQSYFDCRLMGCICEEDSSEIIWMWLFKGEPKRCECGHWFKLEKYKPF